jgi:nucleotide-binding universal stress UspA family protein
MSAHSFPALLTVLQPGGANAAVLEVAAELALRWRSHVLGVAAAQIGALATGGAELDGNLLLQLEEELQRELRAAESEFRLALGSRAASIDWRSQLTLEPLVDFVATNARVADLIITAAHHGSALDFARQADTGELVLKAGRPVLIVPAARPTAPFHHALVAWQDTREARRAVADALPLLQAAGRVWVAQVAAARDAERAQAGLDDVKAWLHRHTVEAEVVLSLSEGIEGEALYTLVQDSGADLLVAGAFGHSRLREWLLGGVTRDTLLKSSCSVLLSH